MKTHDDAEGDALFESRERIPTTILSHGEIARTIAERIAGLIREKNDRGESTVLGLATGSTPIGVYRELIRMHREEALDFSRVVTFNVDEYLPMDPDSHHSYARFMRENLFDHINIDPANAHIPSGTIDRDSWAEHCQAYEEAIVEAGGIDFQLLGIGRSGHIGFNEPGSSPGSRTRLIFLDTVTRSDAAADFFGEENVPLEAITMGVATILEAREVALIATGEHKAEVVRLAVEGEIDPDVAATFLQEHRNARVYLDPAASAELTRVAAPWLLGTPEWTPPVELEAVMWLSEKVGSSILRLAGKDYRDNHLSSLLARWGSAGDLNGWAFNQLISKILGKSRLPHGKRILVFSPHPDDDVISLGGLLRKLRENENEITIAYQTSGNIAVFDHDIRRYLDFLRRAQSALGIEASAMAERESWIRGELEVKAPGEVDVPEVQDLKRVIRETEAVSALESVGIDSGRARFLNLPFYQTGKVRKDPITEADVAIVEDLLEEIRPDLLFAAGDFSDPHGTHRMCLEAVRSALATYGGPSPELWLYRGAWQEWGVGEATVFVPLSELELRLKILAIFKHQSQKDKAPFPGPDEREFWQRVEARNKGTADLLVRLGLPAYYAMEAFVVEVDGEQMENPMISTSTLGASR